jgi:hypothetical protein
LAHDRVHILDCVLETPSIMRSKELVYPILEPPNFGFLFIHSIASHTFVTCIAFRVVQGLKKVAGSRRFLSA